MDTTDMQTIPSSSPVLEYAGFLVRLVAYLIDLLILMAISCVLYIPVVIVFFISIATTSPSSDTASSIWVVILLILLFVTITSRRKIFPMHLQFLTR